MSAAPALEVSGLSSGYGEAMIVHDVNLTVAAGEIFAVLGKNGMGKSTLLKTVMGFLRARTGGVRLFGDDITTLPSYRIARRAVAYAPQEQTLFQDLSVEDNLRLGMRGDQNFDDDVQSVSQHFPFIPQRLRQKAGTLSGGEQKMLLVARALMAHPRLMLIDEISEGLQPSIVGRLAEVLGEERRRTGVAILLIEQNVPFVLKLADRYGVLKLGEMVDDGTVGGETSARRIAEHLSV